MYPCQDCCLDLGLRLPLAYLRAVRVEQPAVPVDRIIIWDEIGEPFLFRGEVHAVFELLDHRQDIRCCWSHSHIPFTSAAPTAMLMTAPTRYDPPRSSHDGRGPRRTTRMGWPSMPCGRSTQRGASSAGDCGTHECARALGVPARLSGLRFHRTQDGGAGSREGRA